MTQLGEAIARYHKLIESAPFKDLSWAVALHEQMASAHLTEGGHPISPFLRPHFVTRRRYNTLVKAAEVLFSAIDRVKQMALGNPSLLARMELLPAEKMLATVQDSDIFEVSTPELDDVVRLQDRYGREDKQ